MLFNNSAAFGTFGQRNQKKFLLIRLVEMQHEEFLSKKINLEAANK